jgi:hypothetical protein
MQKVQTTNICRSKHPEVTQEGWQFLGEGAFNTAYQSMCGQFVLKIPRPKGKDTEDPERSVQIFCEIHPEYAQHTQLIKIGPYTGWQMPYFKGREANDHEITKKLIDIYVKTGRIVMDAPSKDNFICTDAGEVICVDVSFAFRLHTNLWRRASFSSLELWKNYEHQYKNHFFQRGIFIDYYQQTIFTIKALITIQKFAPDLNNLDFLHQHSFFARHLAKIYDYDQSNDAQAIHQKIMMMQHYAFETLKQRCLENLSNYLKARCYLNDTFFNFLNHPQRSLPKLELSWFSFLFRNHQLTYQKIELVQQNIQKIHRCQDFFPLEQIVEQFDDPEDKLRNRFFQSGLKTTYMLCQNDVFYARLFINKIL